MGIVFQSPKNCAVTGLRVYKSTQTKFRDMSHTQIYIYIYIHAHVSVVPCNLGIPPPRQRIGTDPKRETISSQCLLKAMQGYNGSRSVYQISGRDSPRPCLGVCRCGPRPHGESQRQLLIRTPGLPGSRASGSPPAYHTSTTTTTLLLTTNLHHHLPTHGTRTNPGDPKGLQGTSDPYSRAVARTSVTPVVLSPAGRVPRGTLVLSPAGRVPRGTLVLSEVANDAKPGRRRLL